MEAKRSAAPRKKGEPLEAVEGIADGHDLRAVGLRSYKPSSQPKQAEPSLLNKA